MDKVQTSHKKYLIDTDCGVDDAECIFTCLGHLDVIALTTVAGNTNVDQCAINCAKVLQLSNKTVPIFKGCVAPLV